MRALAPLLLLVLSPSWASEGEECIDFAEHIVALEHLQVPAMRGSLSENDIACLEDSYSRADSQTDKGKISRVLLANALVTDSAEWARLVKRHLDEVERSDPDITYLYANFLFNQDQPDYAAVVNNADLSYERRDAWEGTTYTNRSHHLLRLKSIAMLRMWQRLEADAADIGTEDARAKADESRLRTHQAAREWLDFDRASKIVWLEAAQVCISSGTEQACGLREGWRERAASGS